MVIESKAVEWSLDICRQAPAEVLAHLGQAEGVSQTFPGGGAAGFAWETEVGEQVLEAVGLLHPAQIARQQIRLSSQW